MARVRRIDIGELAKPIKRADGTMIAQAKLARTGVMGYADSSFPGGIRKEYRPDSSVFDVRSMDSFKLVPITNNHPPVMITAENARQYQVGAVGQDIHQDGKWIVSTIAIHDAATVRDMENGKTQVSNGYDCDLVMQPGVSPEGERYDAVQTNIVGNHMAIVDSARAGNEAAVRMDAAAQVIETETQKPKVDAMTLEQALAALAAAQEKLGAATSRADRADQDVKDAKAKLDALTTELAQAKELAVKADGLRKDAVDGRDAFVTARVALLTAVASVLRTDSGEPQDLSKKSDREIKLQLIKHVTDVDAATNPRTGKPASDDYIDARFDAAIEQAGDSEDTFRKANSFIEEQREQDPKSTRKDTDAAYQEMVKANRNGWKDSASYADAPSKK